MNFTRKEFACKCGCGFNCIDYELLKVMEDIRVYFTDLIGEQCYIVITSGNRCYTHNKDIGGAVGSQHVKGKACDFKVYIKSTDDQLDSNIVYSGLVKFYPDKYGIGKYDGRTHIDVRPYKARWG